MKVISDENSEVISVSEVKDVADYSVLTNGRTEKLLGEQPDHRIRATAVIENNKLTVGDKG